MILNIILSLKIVINMIVIFKALHRFVYFSMLRGLKPVTFCIFQYVKRLKAPVENILTIDLSKGNKGKKWRC